MESAQPEAEMNFNLPDSPRKKASKRHVDDELSAAKQAVIWVKKAANGSSNWVGCSRNELPEARLPCTTHQYEWYMIYKMTRGLDYGAKMLLIVIALFEGPAACQGTLEQCSHADQFLYSWNLPVFPIRIRMCCALILYLIIGTRLLLFKRKAYGPLFQFSGWTLFQTSVVIVGAASSMTTFIGAQEDSIYWLIAILCRPFTLVGGTKKLRNAFISIFKSITANESAVAWLIATLFLSIWVFVWMGMVFFARTAEGKRDFFSWADACASMWILFTTSNDPNDWIPAYSHNRLSVFFFVIFLVLMLYLLLNLLIANVYQAYKTIMHENLLSHQEERKKSLGEAFLCLSEKDEDGYRVIERERWNEFIEAQYDPYIGFIQVGDSTDSDYNLQRCQKILRHTYPRIMEDFNNLHGMEYPHFEEVMRAMISRGMYIPSRTDKMNKSEWWLHQFFQRGQGDEGSLRFDKGIDFLILLLVPLTIWASVNYAAAKQDPDCRHFLSFKLLFVFACLFAVGLTFKIMVLGFGRFWYRNHRQHRFDFFNLYLLFIASMVYFLIVPWEWLAQVVLILHILRCMRLLAYLRHMRDLFTIAMILVPTFWQMLLVLFVGYYLFAVVGQYEFGGYIYTTNPVLAGTNFATSSFWPLNFNDLPSGFVTLFALMIVNNWYEIAQGFMLATHSNLSALYFVLFFVLCNLIVLNIIISVIIDCNAALVDLHEARERVETETRVELKFGRRESALDVEIGEGFGSPNSETILRNALGAEDRQQHGYLCSDSSSEDEDDERTPSGRTRGSRGRTKSDYAPSYGTMSLSRSKPGLPDLS